MNSIFDREIAEQAITFVSPIIENVLKEIAKRPTIYVVVRDSKGKILTEATFGDENTEKWEYPYAKIAKGKARLAHRTKMDTGLVVNNYPHLLQQGDPLFQGGAYCHGIAVGVSGVAGYFDEIISTMIATACKAFVAHKLAQIKATDPNFL